jgi:Ca2+-binding RTX toxin-like protein
VANLFWDSLTATQVANLSASDTLFFATGAASEMAVTYNPFTTTAGPTITLSGLGHSYTFDDADNAGAIRGLTTNFISDGSILYVGTTGADNVVATGGSDALFGGEGSDSLFGAAGDDHVDGGAGDDLILVSGTGIQTGGDGADTVDASAASGAVHWLDGGRGDDSLLGSAGADTIVGDGGSDTLAGGAGRDILFGGGGGVDQFNFAHGDTTPTNGQWDVISDWAAGDKLHFAGPAVSEANYVEVTTADAVSAVQTATTEIGANTHDVVAVQVGADVLVFVDSAGDNTVGDAVVLVGKSLADIDSSNFV